MVSVSRLVVGAALNLPKEELKKFAEDVLERFNNPFVDHQVTSIMLNSFGQRRDQRYPREC